MSYYFINGEQVPSVNNIHSTNCYSLDQSSLSDKINIWTSLIHSNVSSVVEFSRWWVLKVFWPKINILKGNYCILRMRGTPVRQKLDMILENKVVQKLKLEKNVFSKKWSPKLIFINEKNSKKFHRFLTYKINF